jgi:hypothetical protein
MFTITKKIAIVIIIFLALILLYIYVKSERDHRSELARIRDLERKRQLILRKRDNARNRTVECHVPGLDNPRDCYLKSNRECKWDNEAHRCNLVDN